VLCSPHLRFNNLTLISTHGLPGSLPPISEYQMFLASSHCFNDKDYAHISLHSWVNVVTGKMIGIDRAAKYVEVTQGKKVPYDHLILCTGQQYQVPCPTEADISQLPTNEEITICPGKRYMGKVPSNLFTLNDDEDCVNALLWLRENFIYSEEGAFVIYFC
uniref:Uncharacterized protein n=1 Tax=Latimeria chalumnae TaxID=7897 RepID=H2ZT27_LATCH